MKGEGLENSDPVYVDWIGPRYFLFPSRPINILGPINSLSLSLPFAYVYTWLPLPNVYTGVWTWYPRLLPNVYTGASFYKESESELIH